MSQNANDPFVYCNPLPLPDYPRGRSCDKKNSNFWRHDERPDYRELADPSVLYYEGKWYLYPSGCMVYVSDDFVNWTLHPMEPRDIGYAPTVVEADGTFYLTACGAGLYQSDNPLGPFEKIGPILDDKGEEFDWLDPMLFHEDGRLFAYWGIGAPGISGVEMDMKQPNRMLNAPQILFSFDPEHEWERNGEYNEDPTKSFIEGAWMIKIDGTYFLTYAGPGTQWRTYAMGTYVGKSPLGPFTYQQRNPILRTTQGLIQGPGHGSIVKGPNDTLWAFYTCLHCQYHIFERRLGMDPAGIDEQGQLFVHDATETPQLAPGTRSDPALGNSAGWLPVSIRKNAFASSHSPGRTAAYATDNNTLTWWEPAEGDRECPSIKVHLDGQFKLKAARIIWSESGLNYPQGITPAPVSYLLESSLDGENWESIIDKRNNSEDMLIDFQTFPEKTAQWIRLTIHYPEVGYALGVSNLTVFA